MTINRMSVGRAKKDLSHGIIAMRVMLNIFKGVEDKDGMNTRKLFAIL